MSQMINQTDATTRKQTFQIEGMHCGSCVARIEEGLKRAFPHLHDVQVNLATGQAVVEGPVESQQVLGVIEEMGYQARLQPLTVTSSEQASKVAQADRAEEAATRQARRRLSLAVVLTIPLFAIHMTGWHFTGSAWVQLPLATTVLFYCGQSIFSSAFRLLRRGESNMDTLIALGAGTAWLASVGSLALVQAGRLSHANLYFETGAMIITLILLGRYLETQARGRAGDAIRALMRLQPNTALLQRQGQWVEVPLGEIKVGDRLMVKPGSRIPLDGVVEEGEALVNEAMMTGESELMHKKQRDAVMGGTFNESGSLTIQVTEVGEMTVLSRIIALVNEAQTRKPPIQRFADKVAGIFVPIVLVLAAATLLGWWLTGHTLGDGLSAAIAVLVIACPCALGLATPTAIQVGLGRAASQGILIRRPEGLEIAHRLDVLVMDKTGTLTVGEPRVVNFEARPGFAADDCLRWAAALESRSEHPLAKAIVEYAAQHGQKPQNAGSVQHFTSQAGAGVTAQVQGRRIMIGKPDYLALNGVAVVSVSDHLDYAAQRGQTPVLLAVENQLAGYFFISDPLKPEAREAIQRLRANQIKPVMLSGDKAETAQAVGRQAGLKPGEIKADVSPQEKLTYLKAMQEIEHGYGRAVVGMVGDGINDAPALAQADVSIAMGTGTDIAMQTAQITLVHGDISKVVAAIELSRAILKTIRQNLFWAFFYNLVALPLAALGLLNPMIAAAAMALSSVTVVLNSLRLRRA